MLFKFKGSVTDLHLILKELQIVGKFRKRTNDYWQYYAFSGAVLNFWPRKGTITIQGPEEEKAEMECLIVNYAEDDNFANKDAKWYLKDKK